MTQSNDISRSSEIMAALRRSRPAAAVGLKQTLRDIAPYTIEKPTGAMRSRAAISTISGRVGDLRFRSLSRAHGEERQAFAFADVSSDHD